MIRVSRRAVRQRLRSRRIRVALAAGLVLGIGSLATLAAWTDTENATGGFATSVFDTESQSAGSTAWASRPTAPGATLTFSATGMSPGVAHYAWLNVRTTAATTVAGSVALTSMTRTNPLLTDALQYRIVRMPAPNPTSSCTAASFSGSPVFIAGGAATHLTVPQLPASPIASPIAAAGGAIGYCIEVRVSPSAPNSAQGQTATVTWGFTATSAD